MRRFPFRHLALALLLPCAAPDLMADPPVADLPYGSEPYQLFDWYPAYTMPNHPPGARPWVLYAHGSGSNKSGIGHMAFGVMADLLRQNGISVFAANWGNYPHVYPTMRDDFVAAIQHIKHNALAFDIDRDRMVLWGVSAGSVVSGWLVYGPDFKVFGAIGPKAQSTRPLAFMNWGGLTNFLLMDPGGSGYAFGVPTYGDLSPAFLQSISFAHMLNDVPRTFTPPVQSYYGFVEGPLPYKNPHDVGLMKDLHAKLAAFPAVAAQSTQLQNLTHPTVVHAQLESLCDWTRAQLGVDGTPLNLGGQAAGKSAFPKLYGTGTFAAASTSTLSFVSARKETTALILFCGAARTDIKIGAATLLVEPSIALLLLTDALGELHATLPLGASLPAAQTRYLQFLHADDVPGGVAASNAIRIVTS